MAWLKIYEWERNTYPEFREFRIGRSDSLTYFKKFARHFKISIPRLGTRLLRHNGVYFPDDEVIQLPLITSLSLVIHEFAHHLATKKYGSDQGHNKNFKRSLKRVYTFAKRYLKKNESII